MTNTLLNPPASVQTAEETEQQLIEATISDIAKESDCKWSVGRRAHLWTQEFAGERSDADFAELVGLSRAQVQQRRQVYATYADVCNTYCNLGWSHFVVVLGWDDADEWLGDANQGNWSVAKMKEMRDRTRGALDRIDRGEDLTQPNEGDQSNEGTGTEAGNAASDAALEDSTSHQDGDDNVRTDPADGTTPSARVTGNDLELSTRDFDKFVASITGGVHKAMQRATGEQRETLKQRLLTLAEEVANE